MRGGDIGADRVRRSAAVMGKIAAPARGQLPAPDGLSARLAGFDQPPADHSAKAAPKEHQQFRAVTRVEALARALAERKQAVRQRRLAIDPDQRLGADQVAAPARTADGRARRCASRRRRPARSPVATICGSTICTPLPSARNPWSPTTSASATASMPRISGHSWVTTWNSASTLSASIAASTAAWIAATAPEWPRAKAIRSWLASSTRPAARAGARPPALRTGSPVPSWRDVTPRRLISYNPGRPNCSGRNWRVVMQRRGLHHEDKMR